MATVGPGRRWLGVVAVAVTLSTILLATLLSPAFTWGGNALSNLGVTATDAGTGLTVVLFNGGLVVGGLLGIAFGVWLVRERPTAGARPVGVLFALTVTSMGLVGVFPQDQSLHFPVALGFYALISVTLWADAALAVSHGLRRRGAVSGALGTANVLTWVLWGATGPPLRAGLALPEIVGAVLFSAWVVWFSLGLDRWPLAPTGQSKL